MTSKHEYGSNPIDRIFCSKTIQITAGGHCSGTESSDHKMIWIDIPKEDIVGTTTAAI